MVNKMCLHSIHQLLLLLKEIVLFILRIIKVKVH